MARMYEAPRIQTTRIHGQITLYVAVNLIIIEKQELFFLIEGAFIFIEHHSSLIRDVERSIENFVNLSRHSRGAANVPRAKRRPPALLRQSRGPCLWQPDWIRAHRAARRRRRSAVQREGRMSSLSNTRVATLRSAVLSRLAHRVAVSWCGFSSFSRARADRCSTEAPPVPRTTPETESERGGSRPWRNFIPFASRVALPRPTTSAEVGIEVVVVIARVDIQIDRIVARRCVRNRATGGASSLPETLITLD